MEFRKFVILGAGPTGLAFARTLLDLGQDSFVVLEKEPVPGGLCRSEEVDGAPLDIGGGHFLDLKRPEVLSLIFRFLPEQQWRQFDRISRIRLGGTEIDYPVEANIWQMSDEQQIEFLESIAKAGCVSGAPEPEGFVEWIKWKLGESIANEYMLPYNRKIWSEDLTTLGTYWLNKLPDVSFRDTLMSCIKRTAFGSIPAHGKFLYPKKHGYGEVWKRIGDSLGERLLVNSPVTSIDIGTMTVNERFSAEKIINTIPWPVWLSNSSLPVPVKDLISSLKHVPIDIDYYPGAPGTDAHWIYEPDEKVSHHRELNRCNFCGNARGYWTETNSRRAVSPKVPRFRNEYAYPINSTKKPESMAKILQWAEANSIIGLGRWGRWEHINSDVAVAEGIPAARKLFSAGEL